jgi:coproporphyrinogen III oxidase-like Fe-S oxidoreductase
VAGSRTRGVRSSVPRFLAALEAELGLRADELDVRWGPPGERAPLDTLYFGGGTPSLLPASAIGRLIGLVRRRFGLSGDAEVSLEANPGPTERGDPTALRDAGVTRLSIGAQSLDDVELRRLGRRHRAADVVDAVATARAAGLQSVSLDLLYDVPEQSLASWARTLDAALELRPDHLSLYALTLDDPAAEGLTGPSGDHLPASPGARRWRVSARMHQDDDRAAAMYELADGRLAAAGYACYEISNWARPGHRSRHNLAYWQGRPWEAVGPGAHAFDGVTRRWNAAGLDAYLGALGPPQAGVGRHVPVLPPGGAERLTPASSAAEATILGLRLARGLSARAARNGPLGRHLEWATGAGLLDVSPAGRYALTLRGRLLSNELFSRLV